MKKLICLVLVLLMALTMSACNRSTEAAYKAALIAYDTGEYESAATAFSSLRDYMDSPALLASIRADKISAELITIINPAPAPAGTEVEEIPPVLTSVAYTLQDELVVKENITYEDGTITGNTYAYDDMGNCIAETTEHPDGTKTQLEHLYQDGRKLGSVRTNPDGSQDVFTYTHNAEGRVTAHTLVYADGTEETAVYVYNEQGLVYSIATTAGALTTYKYNAFNDLTKITCSQDGLTTYTVAYEYTYQCSLY